MKKIESDEFIEHSSKLDGSPFPKSLNEDEVNALESDLGMHFLLEKHYNTISRQASGTTVTGKGEHMEWISVAAGFVLLFSVLFQSEFSITEDAASELATSNKVFRALAVPLESKNRELQQWKNNPSDISLFQKAYEKATISEPELAQQLLKDFEQLNGFSAPVNKNSP